MFKNESLLIYSQTSFTPQHVSAAKIVETFSNIDKRVAGKKRFSGSVDPV